MRDSLEHNINQSVGGNARQFFSCVIQNGCVRVRLSSQDQLQLFKVGKMATNNTSSQTYQLSESEKRTLDDCCSHAQSILDVINELKQNGCSTKPLILKCPMEELQTIIEKANSVINKKKPPKSKTKLTGKEISHYLESKIVIDDTLSKIIYPPPNLLRNPAAGSLHQLNTEIIPSIKKSP